MGDQQVTKVEFVAALTPTLNALAAQMAMLTTNLNSNNNITNNKNNRNNPDRGGGPIPVIRVRKNNHTIVTYRKSKHIRESDLEYYERRY